MGSEDAASLVTPSRFLELFPALPNLEIRWTFCPAYQPPFMKKRFKFPEVRFPQPIVNTDITNLKVEIYDTYDTAEYEVDDDEKIRQLGWILHQIGCPHLKRLFIRCTGFAFMHRDDSSPDWSRLFQVFQRCRYPCLDSLQLTLNFGMNDAIERDFCVSLSQVVQRDHPPITGDMARISHDVLGGFPHPQNQDIPFVQGRTRRFLHVLGALFPRSPPNRCKPACLPSRS
jgi:hypothetical protein